MIQKSTEQPVSVSSRATGVKPPTLLDRPFRLMVLIVAVIFFCETAVMLVMPLLPSMSSEVQAVVDSALLIAVLIPLLSLLVLRPVRARHAERERAAAILAESEQRFRDIAENADEWIWEVDTTGRYTYSSGAVERILGYTPEEVLELHFYDLFHPDDRDDLRVAALDAFASRQPFREFLNRNVHKNGKSVWLATSGVPILDADGSLLGYRGADTVKFEEAAVTDTLTQLVNRRGLTLLGEQQIRTAI
ncbi:MAG: PAS domain S-box protein, partial [Candidatus Tectomicrobia bacterium]|nr:PAS domain S-box protein [Candidatus Tectomicrobia bacterium]